MTGFFLVFQKDELIRPFKAAMASYFQQVLPLPIIHFLVGVEFFRAERGPAHWFGQFSNLWLQGPIFDFSIVIIAGFHKSAPTLKHSLYNIENNFAWKYR